MSADSSVDWQSGCGVLLIMGETPATQNTSWTSGRPHVALKPETTMGENLTLTILTNTYSITLYHARVFTRPLYNFTIDQCSLLSGRRHFSSRETHTEAGFTSRSDVLTPGEGRVYMQ